MSEYKIEKNIPVPTIKRGPAAKYPLNEMGIGESFFIGDKKAAVVYMLVTRANDRYKPNKYMSRKEGAGYRIWRLE